MRVGLVRHPDSPTLGVAGIGVAVSRRAGTLTLRYELTGDLGLLRVPVRAASTRTDELWRHTCFEAFVRTQGEGYAEFNFSLSSQWAAYRFDSYRSGMRAAEIAPTVTVETYADRLAVTAIVEDAAFAGALTLGLSAVIESADGAIAYWAAAHPPGRPDFHHADCFAVRLPASV